MSLAFPDPLQNPELLGQERAEQALLRAHRRGRMPHAWLFTGRFGIGKATLAFRLARFLLAGGGDTLEVPSDHPVVGPVAAGAHPDLVHVAPKAGGRGSRAIIDVDTVRDAIERIRRTGIGSHRVLVIEEAHALNPNAANALLKTLEEPGAGVVIVLTADSDARFPGTIRSRVARLRLAPVATRRIEGWLAQHGVDAEAARAMAPLAAGSPGLAVWLHRAGALDHYGRLCTSLETARGEAGTGAIAGVLETMLASEDPALVRELLGQLVRRSVATALGERLEPLAEAEAPVLARQSRRLDRLWEVWDKLAVLDAVAERLSLDRRTLLVDIAATLTPADRPASS